ncbi:MAG: MFS transporter, partial [Cucumibacter sp.]
MTDLVKVSALLLGSALLMFAGGLHGLLTAIRGGQEGFSLVALGLIGTSWSVGFVAGTILVPRLVSRVGHVRSFSVMASVASIVILVNVMFVEQYSWIVLRAVSGFCFAGAAMVVESWLNEVTTNQRRGTVFAAYMMANLAAATAGQLVLAWVGVAGFMAFVLGAAAYSLAVLPTALSLSPQPRPLVRASLDLGLLWRTSPIALVAAFAVGVT